MSDVQRLLYNINESLDREPDGQFELLKFAATVAGFPAGMLERIDSVSEFYQELQHLEAFAAKADSYFAAFLEIVHTKLDLLKEYRRYVNVSDVDLRQRHEDLRFPEFMVEICNQLPENDFKRLRDVLGHELAPTNSKTFKSRTQLFTRLYFHNKLNADNLKEWMKRIPLEKMVGLIQEYKKPGYQWNEAVSQGIQLQADAATASITPNETSNLESSPVQKRPPMGTRAIKGKELGRGAFGYVCQMLDETGAELCVGKYFHPGMIGDKHFGTKFAKETVILEKLIHPNIVRYIESLTPISGGDYCLLMERMAYSLHEYVYKMTPDQLPLSVKLSILLNVANGLSYLHSQSPTIIHRDLTAHNVLLTASDPPIAKIADFGNCCVVSFESSSQLKSLTEKPGTPHYMAPEACKEHGDPRYNTKLDIFSFGNLALFTFIQSTISSLLPIVGDMGPDGRYDVRTEIDRRRDHFEKLTLPSTHPAVIMMKACLSQKPEDRPDACTLVTCLEEMRATPPVQETDGVAEGVGALSLGGSEACGPDVPEPSTSDPNHMYSWPDIR